LLLRLDKMEVNIKEEIKNPLFRRKEIKLEVEAEITPSRLEAEKIVCDKLSCKPEVVKLRKIDGSFGSKTFTIIVDLYDSEQDKKEYAPMLKKKEIELEKKKAETEKSAKEAAPEGVPPIDEAGGKEEKPVEKAEDNTQKDNNEVKEESSEQGEEKKE